MIPRVIPARISWKIPLLAAAAGLVVGLGAKWISHHEPVAEAGKTEIATRKSPARPARGGPRMAVPPAARFIEGLAKADAVRCEELFREMTADGAAANPLELEAVFARWMELAGPQEILATVKASGIAERRWTAPFFEAWAAENYAAAMAGTAKTGDFSEIRALVAIRRGDPAFLAENFDIWDADKSPVADALAALGRNDPELAKGVATRHESTPDQNAEAIAAVARGWADRDPAAALEWVKSLALNNSNRAGAVNAVLASWLKTDPAAAAKAAESLEVFSRDRVLPRGPLADLHSPESTLSQISLLNQTEPFASVSDLYRRLSESPVDWETHPYPIRAINTDGWFVTDPAKAAAEAAGLPPGGARDFILSTICAQWADRSPAEATAFAEAHGLKPPFVTIDPPASELGADPAATLAPLFAGDNLDDTSSKRLRALEAKWSQIEPRAAAEWLIKQPESVSFDHAADPESSTLLNNALGYYWARIDAKGAARWAENLPDGPRRDNAWNAMKFYVANYSPDLVFTTSAKILADDRRMETLAADLRKVADKLGPPAAREALQTVYLSADERAELAESLDHPSAAAK